MIAFAAWIPSAACSTVTIPPFNVIVPAESVSPSSGVDLIPSPSVDLIWILPLSIVTEPSDANALSTDVIFKFCSFTVKAVVAPPLIPFFPFADTLTVPLPESVSVEPSFALITAFSASALSEDAFAAVSANVFSVPAAAMISASAVLFTQIGAVVCDVSVKPSNTITTFFVSFFTLTEPSVQLPFNT